MFPATDVSLLFLGSNVRNEGNLICAEYDGDILIESSVHPDGIVTTSVPGTPIMQTQDTAFDLPPNREIKRQLYRVLAAVIGRSFPWGSLTGIRPTQIAREVRDADDMSNFYDVRKDKARLAIETAETEDRILATTSEEDLFVYIGIPFCPGRCSYCSFTTQESRSDAGLLPEYLNAVLREVSGLSSKLKNVRAVYFGGGTPTIMDEELLGSFVDGCLDLIGPDRSAEITVEAGRPDTLTPVKLETLSRAGVSRICVNPQSLSDRTLAAIGRKHTAEQFCNAFQAARKAGFHTINTDLIAGLPGESMEEFRFSVDRIIELLPENITVHALCKKRSADIKREEIFEGKDNGALADDMVSYADSKIRAGGYFPYYLYKQKDTVGGLENTGFSKPGKECLYNVAMMSDLRNVLSFGAGGVSKRFFSSRRLERFDCVRNPKEYIERIDEILIGKRRFFEV